jgi:hypothetical protein
LVVSSISFGQECRLLDSPGLRSVYILQRLTPGLMASRFKVALGEGVTFTFVSETIHMPAFSGSTQTGISLCYGECIAATRLLATISYMAYGTSLPCGQIHIVPHPRAQTADAIMCDGTPISLVINDLYVTRVVGDCGCPGVHILPGTPLGFDCAPLALQSRTWGAVKALYAN